MYLKIHQGDALPWNADNRHEQRTSLWFLTMGTAVKTLSFSSRGAGSHPSEGGVVRHRDIGNLLLAVRIKQMLWGSRTNSGGTDKCVPTQQPGWYAHRKLFWWLFSDSLHPDYGEGATDRLAQAQSSASFLEDHLSVSSSRQPTNLVNIYFLKITFFSA